MIVVRFKETHWECLSHTNSAPHHLLVFGDSVNLHEIFLAHICLFQVAALNLVEFADGERIFEKTYPVTVLDLLGHFATGTV